MDDSTPDEVASAKQRGGLAKLGAGLGLTLCTLCCAAPLVIGAGLGTTALLAYAAIGEKVGLALLVLSVIGYLVARAQRRRAASCSVDCAARPKQA